MHARCWLETATIEAETGRNRTPEKNPENSCPIHVTGCQPHHVSHNRLSLKTPGK